VPLGALVVAWTCSGAAGGAAAARAQIPAGARAAAAAAGPPAAVAASSGPAAPVAASSEPPAPGAASAGPVPEGPADAAPGAAATVPAAAPEAAPGGPPDPEALARTYRRTGAAPTVETSASGGRGAVTLIPFGHARPVLRCAPLRACAVELAPDEAVLATSLGDGERWLLQAAATGPGARTPLLVVKPTACDLATNLLVSTDRRVYEIGLESPPCHDADSGEGGAYNPRLPFTALIRFYYPDELVRRFGAEERAARERAAQAAEGRTPLDPGARLARLNFDYAWDRGKRWPWVPVQVFDDGLHSYLVLPPAARLAELPILLAVEPGGGLALVNSHLDGQTLVADRVLERAVLIVGHGRRRDEQRLEIVNRGFGRRSGS
jgi:type IV secretion system protein TrbG